MTRYDRGDKRFAYLSPPSLRENLLIAQDRMRVEVLWVDSPGEGGTAGTGQ